MDSERNAAAPAWPASISENRGAILRDYTLILWLFKLGGLLNLYFLINTFRYSFGDDLYVIVPAQILFGVSTYRCFFPCRYEDNVVFHDSIFSSIFATRLLATFAEIAWIYLFSYILRLLNANHVQWVNLISWLMVVQVVVSQCFVWAAILTGQLELYVYEELGWFFIFIANTIVSAYVYLTVAALGGREVLLILNLLFGVSYLPFEFTHLVTLRAEARSHRATPAASSPSIRLVAGLKRSILEKNRRTDADSWGGRVGLIWMTGYWATLIPMWFYYIVKVLCPH